MIRKYKLLKEHLARYGRVGVAFSGGADSSFLLYAAKDALGAENVTALTAVGNLLKKQDIENIINMTDELGVAQIFVELKMPDEFRKNTQDRCYICKKNMMNEFAKALPGAVILEGSNVDDANKCCSGLKAVEENGAKTPLIELGICKSEIRAFSYELGLRSWKRAKNACLASRIPCGTYITDEIISQVEAAEEYLSSLGYANARIRYHGDIAMIEISEEDMKKALFHRADISNNLKRLGFKHIGLDMEGIRNINA